MAPLCIVDNVIFRTYCPSPASDSVTVPLVPPSLCQQSLQEAHDMPPKVLENVKPSTTPGIIIGLVWLVMHNSTVNNVTNAKCPIYHPLFIQNVPIGNPYKVLAIDI